MVDKTESNRIKVYDFFSGCGGTSAGLRNSGMDIVLGLDFDKDAGETFTRNFPESNFICADIREIKQEDLEIYIDKNPNRDNKILFTGCAPCQPFSVLNRWRDSHLKKIRSEEEFKVSIEKEKLKENLLLQFIRFIKYYLPDFIFVENVPGFQKISSEHGPFRELLRVLDELGYHYPEPRIVEMKKYGVPQRRRRIVIIASRLGKIDYPKETHDGEHIPFVTVFDKIGGKNALPPIAAGEKHPWIPNHQAANLSELNLQRIKSLLPGQNRLYWADDLKLKCHKGKDHVYSDVYGRLFWNEPATGLTTKCISLSNGRFGHPDQNRAISTREAARLQTFSDDFIFEGPLTSVARQIGNAVPTLFAERFGDNFFEHLRQV
ncbi:MAG TPA: DNA cytosine methyltransferase [Pyrinomonadaceae bacterium]|jgi:DNA (cytosine-5)-methyltransferase 1